MDLSSRQLEAFRRFLDKLPHGKDIELVILKAHLLIEEQVHLILKHHLPNHNALKDTNFDCFENICLAQAILPYQVDDRFWIAAKKLNRIRNKIAHTVDHNGIDHMIKDFIKSVPVDWGTENNQETFELSIWCLFVHISSFVDGNIDQFVANLIPATND